MYLSQAKTDAFHLPYREGKIVHFICLVLNLIFIIRCNNMTVMGLQRLYLTFEIGGGHEDVKSSSEHSAISGFSLPLQMAQKT